MVEQNVIEELIGAIKQDPQIRNRTHSAVVARVDDEGVVWVYVAGNDQETPTESSSAEVKRGDGVMVEWRNNKLYIVGNTSDPSAGKERVQAVEDAAAKAGAAASRALTAAASAEESAETAATAAAAAVEDAAAAGRAAAAAGTAAAEADRKATAAGLAASDAQTSADNAQASANNASEYAARALGNLSTVQSVTETLNWITAHGTMTKTDDYVPSADTEVVEGKKYYTRSGSGTAQDPYVYTLVSNPTGDPSASGYYEGALDPTHVYFVQDSNGDYTVGGVKYAVVTEPSIDDIADYYVLSIDESLNNYVATHLSLTNDGLYVMADNSEWKVKVADNGVFILDPNNVPANSMMADKTVVGYENDTHVIVDSDSLDIANGEMIIASFGETTVIGEEGSSRIFLLQDSMSMVLSNDIEVFNISLSGNQSFRIETKKIIHLSLYAPTRPGMVASKRFAVLGNYVAGTILKIITRIADEQTTTSWTATFPVGGGTTQSKRYGDVTWEISFDSTVAVTVTARANRVIDTHPYIVIDYVTGMEFIKPPIFTIGTRALDSSRGDFSFSGGYDNAVSGATSFTHGHDNTVSGESSFAFGHDLETGYNDQVVIGYFNDNQSDTLFEIGGGMSGDPWNALTVDEWGHLKLKLGGWHADGDTTDADLYAAITALGWESEVID